MISRPYRVGRPCDAWCTRCKTVTEHTVIALVGQTPKRVQCSSCGGQHNFRLPGQSGNNNRPPSTRPKGKTRRPAGNWEKLIAEAIQEEPRPYAISEEFQVQELVTHPHFGPGIVQQVLPDRKIEVLFQSGVRLLAHGR